MSGQIYSRRLATQDEFLLLYAIHRQAFQTYVEQAWGQWDEAAQEAQFRAEFEVCLPEVILCRDEIIGAVRVEKQADYVFVDYITIRPQNHGHGYWDSDNPRDHRYGCPAR